MPELTAKRTLVKSPPELWEELSEVERLAKHLGAFGEIKITKLDPEHTVAWEGEHASGTVSIEPSGWGTKVILTAELAAGADSPDPPEAAPDEPTADPVDEEPPPAAPAEEPAAANEEPAAQAEEPAAEYEEPDAEVEPAAPALFTYEPPPRRRGFWRRLFAGWLVPEERLNRAAPARQRQALVSERVPVEEPVAVEEPVVVEESTAVEHEAPVVEHAAPEALEIELEPAVAEPDAEESPAEPEPPAAEPVQEESGTRDVIDHEHAQSVLVETLDALGSAHHRPFSRG